VNLGAERTSLKYLPHPSLDPNQHWRETRTALHYARAAQTVGLWETEKLLCQKYLPRDEPLLELGCGGGRIALGLWQEGWRQVRQSAWGLKIYDLESGCRSVKGLSTKGLMRAAPS
jgi:hypothetical protein